MIEMLPNPGVGNLFNDDPYGFFATASGPTASEMYGPSSSVLDTYFDGTPVAHAEHQLGTGSGLSDVKHSTFFHRGDVQAFLLMVLGYAMIRSYVA